MASSPEGEPTHEIRLAIAARDPELQSLIATTLESALNLVRSCCRCGTFDELVGHCQSVERPPVVTVCDSSICEGESSNLDLFVVTARLQALAQPLGIVLLVGPGREAEAARALGAGCDEALPLVRPECLGLLPAMVRRAARNARARRLSTPIRNGRQPLQISEEAFARLFRSSPNILVISRLHDGLIYEVNDRWESVFGYSRSESIGRTTNELKLFADAHAHAKMVDVLRRDGCLRGYEVSLCTASGALRSIQATAEIVELSSETCVLTTLQDVTDQRRAEARAIEHLAALAHVERLVTAGELASGMAHELNQPLSAIRVHAELASAALSNSGAEDVSAARVAIAIVSDQAQRASSIIRMLRSMVRKEDVQRSNVDLHEIARSTASFVEPIARRHGVALNLRLGPEPIAVLGDFVLLSQSLLNLLQNALEAVLDQPDTRRQVEVATEVFGDEARLSVVDRGCGLSTETSPRLFAPFFTTRPEGLGLGLAISKSIVEAHRGSISGAGNEFGGATFTITLPRCAQGSASS